MDSDRRILWRLIQAMKFYVSPMYKIHKESCRHIANARTKGNFCKWLGPYDSECIAKKEANKSLKELEESIGLCKHCPN